MVPELARAYSLAGAAVLVYPTAIGSEPDHPDFDTEPLWEKVIIANGIANGTFMVAVNRIGFEDPVTFYGSSFISDPYGRKLVQAPRDEPAVLVADLDIDQRRDWLELFPFLTPADRMRTGRWSTSHRPQTTSPERGIRLRAVGLKGPEANRCRAPSPRRPPVPARRGGLKPATTTGKPTDGRDGLDRDDSPPDRLGHPIEPSVQEPQSFRRGDVRADEDRKAAGQSEQRADQQCHDRPARQRPEADREEHRPVMMYVVMPTPICQPNPAP